MKKSAEIVGLPVISIIEGGKLGTIKDLVFNHKQGLVEGLVIDDGKWYLGAKVLPFTSVIGIGEDALTVEDTSNLVSVAENSTWLSMFEEDYKVIGNNVLTKTGKMQGKVSEIVINEQGNIVKCEIEDSSGTSEISADRIVTFGKRVIIIAPEGETISRPSFASVTTAKKVTPEQESSVNVKEPTDSATRVFDEKQRKYILGKKANRTITTDNGVMIVEQGSEITEEIIQKAKLAGKFIELSMSIQ